MMNIDMRDSLHTFIEENNIPSSSLQLPDARLDALSIHAIMINEVVPANPGDGFYARGDKPNYMSTVIPLFENAGVKINGIDDILNMGIYITTAVKSPKSGYEVDAAVLQEQLPILEYELGLFPNLKAIMLMGDVAKKAVNMIVKRRTKKNVIPLGATYKIRSQEFYYQGIRVFPSYIMTGGNLLIEKSKCAMISDDIARMMDYLSE